MFDQFDLYRLFTPIKPSLCWDSPFNSILFFLRISIQSKNKIHWTYSERPQIICLDVCVILYSWDHVNEWMCYALRASVDYHLVFYYYFKLVRSFVRSLQCFVIIAILTVNDLFLCYVFLFFFSSPSNVSHQIFFYCFWLKTFRTP